MSNLALPDRDIRETVQENPPERIPVIKAKDVGVKFYANKRREDIKSLTHSLFQRKVKKEDFWALKGIDMTGYQGDIIGVIGFNGAGKTTLCRVISRLLRPDRGEIEVSGEVSALLSLGTGFNRQLTGKENIHLNGMMLGFPRKEIERIYPEIVEFSGLANFIDEPIKYYSKGMKARLGFSIAATLEPEILVLDEALSAGDIEFNERATVRTREIVHKTRAVIIVSHSINYIEKNCTAGVWIDKGEIQAAGEPSKVCALYRNKVDEKKANTKPRRIARYKRTESVAGDEAAVKVSSLGTRFKLQNKTIWALKDVNFSIKDGEVVGIIGQNGAGKTTLCRVLTGLLRADEGSVKVNGEISALLSLGTGFNSQLTGRDNIYLNGLMLGIPRKRLKALFDEIVEFAELERFIDSPVKYYSSGMLSRLGFSIASATEPDVFIIDEALSAGDASFSEKASERIQEMINTSKAVIVVTHNMRFVQRVCTRVIWLKNGRLVFDGNPKEAVNRYKADVLKTRD